MAFLLSLRRSRRESNGIKYVGITPNCPPLVKVLKVLTFTPFYPARLLGIQLSIDPPTLKVIACISCPQVRKQIAQNFLILG